MKHKTKKRPVRNTDDISWGVSFLQRLLSFILKKVT